MQKASSRKRKKLRKIQKAWYLRQISGEKRGGTGAETAHPLKLEAVEAYGGHCVRCDESRPGLLQLDHVKNNGHKHRLLISKGRAGLDFYRALKKAGWPTGGEYPLQLLCFDCHATTTQERRY